MRHLGKDRRKSRARQKFCRADTKVRLKKKGKNDKNKTSLKLNIFLNKKFKKFEKTSYRVGKNILLTTCPENDYI